MGDRVCSFEGGYEALSPELQTWEHLNNYLRKGPIDLAALQQEADAQAEAA